MKLLIQTLIIIFQFTLSFAQQEYEYVPFPTSDAIWSEVYYFEEDINWQPHIYERFTVNGEDTIINAISYKKIYMFLDTFFDKSTAIYIGALREDEQKRIWLKIDSPLHPFKPITSINGEEILLYDFSVQEGDTITSEYINFDAFENIVVWKIDTIQIGNTYRKKIKIRNESIPVDEWPSEYPYPSEIIEWIEGIGSPNGLFFTSPFNIPTASIATNYLIGFKYQDEILYFNDHYPCFYPTNIKKVNNSNMHLIPISGTGFMFDFEDKDNISVVQIYNMTGVLQTTLQKEFILNTNTYAPGIYIYKTMDRFGNRYIGKFKVQ